MLGSKALDFDAYGLFRAMHSHNPSFLNHKNTYIVTVKTYHVNKWGTKLTILLHLFPFLCLFYLSKASFKSSVPGRTNLPSFIMTISSPFLVTAVISPSSS